MYATGKALGLLRSERPVHQALLLSNNIQWVVLSLCRGSSMHGGGLPTARTGKRGSCTLEGEGKVADEPQISISAPPGV